MFFENFLQILGQLSGRKYLINTNASKNQDITYITLITLIT